MTDLFGHTRLARRGTGRGRPPAALPTVLALIAGEKMAGALLAAAVAAYAIAAHSGGLASPLALWIVEATGSVGREVLTWVTAQLSPGMLGWGITAGAYALMLGAEGVGLFGQKGWAEILVLAETALWIPVEVLTLVSQPSASGTVLLLVNGAILAYVWHRFQRRRHLRGDRRRDRVQVPRRTLGSPQHGPTPDARPTTGRAGSE